MGSGGTGSTLLFLPLPKTKQTNFGLSFLDGEVFFNIFATIFMLGWLHFKGTRKSGLSFLTLGSVILQHWGR